MNDNQNYFVTRSTSRVLAQPGGKCSIDIFGENATSAASPPSPAATANSSEAANSSPQAQAEAAKATPSPAALMDEVARNRQRATGESFDLFGGPAEKKPPSPAAAKPAADAPAADSPAENDSAREPFRAEPSPAGSTAKISSNRFASASSTNSYNVITDRPTSRVLQPPGGKCSDIIFG